MIEEPMLMDTGSGADYMSPYLQPGAVVTAHDPVPATPPSPSGQQLTQASQPTRPPAAAADHPEHISMNRETDNLNVLFMGADGDQLLTVTVYSINHHNNYRSGAVFFPVQTALNGGPALTRIFREQGPQALVPLIEAALAVKIAYYVRVDQRILAEVKKFINPIVVEGQVVEVTDLFNRETSPQDDYILGALLAELTQPRVFFVHLPKLFLSFHRYLETDFALTPENLWLHYRIARRIDTAAIPKVVAWGSVVVQLGEPEPVLLIRSDWLGDIIYDLTQTN